MPNKLVPPPPEILDPPLEHLGGVPWGQNKDALHRAHKKLEVLDQPLKFYLEVRAKQFEFDTGSIINVTE